MVPSAGAPRCAFLQSHEPPVAPETTRDILAMMETADQSLAAGGKSILIPEVMLAAESEAAARRPSSGS